MHAKDAIRQTLDMSERIVNAYVGDLDDSDLLVRPVEGMNHIAWQLGHLINTERTLLEGIKPGSSPPIPEDFEGNHSRENTTSDDSKQFLTKAAYLDLMTAQRAATKQVLDSLRDEDLDAPAPERFRRMVATVGAACVLAGSHYIMHVGQFVAVRRMRNKPVAI